MGQFEGIQYTDQNDDFTDVTGTEYAAGRDVQEIAEAVLEATLRAEAAQEALEVVRRQAVRALKGQGYSVRQIAASLDGLSKSAAARLGMGRPWRRQPVSDVDKLVAAVWAEGLTTQRASLSPRRGDKATVYSTKLNIRSAMAGQATN